MSRGSYSDFFLAVRQRESTNNYQAENQLHFLGAYQFGEGALVDLGYVRRDSDWRDNNYSGGWTGKNGIDSKAEFLASPAVQDAAAAQWFPIPWSRARGLDLEVTLGGTHLSRRKEPAPSRTNLAIGHLIGSGMRGPNRQAAIPWCSRPFSHGRPPEGNLPHAQFPIGLKGRRKFPPLRWRL